MILEQTKIKATVADYENLPEGAKYQLINFEITEMPSPEVNHQQVAQNILVLISLYLKEHKTGKIFIAPLDVYLTEGDVYQPDLLFVSNERNDIIKKRIHGAPDLVVEILSESTATYDYRRKKHVYAASGVNEYWKVDMESKSIEIYENTSLKEFTLARIFQEGRVFISKLFPGFTPGLVDIFG